MVAVVEALMKTRWYIGFVGVNGGCDRCPQIDGCVYFIHIVYRFVLFQARAKEDDEPQAAGADLVTKLFIIDSQPTKLYFLMTTLIKYKKWCIFTI